MLPRFGDRLELGCERVEPRGGGAPARDRAQLARGDAALVAGDGHHAALRIVPESDVRLLLDQPRRNSIRRSRAALDASSGRHRRR